MKNSSSILQLDSYQTDMLKLVLPDGYQFNAYDYGVATTFKIYNRDETVFDATNYTPQVQFLDPYGTRVLTVTGAWTTQNQGIGTFAFTATNLLTVATGAGHKIYGIQVQLEKAGVVLTTESKQIVVIASVD